VGPELGGLSRYEEVRTRAEGLFRSPERGPPIRFYGGFSFQEGHEDQGVWEGFPSAAFVLPEVELEQGPRETFLTVQAPLGENGEEQRVRRALRTRIGNLQARLTEGSPLDSRPEPPQPTHRVESDRGGWKTAVEETLQAIRSGEVSKVVLARTLDLSTPRPVDPLRVLLHLRRENTGAHVFFFEPSPGVVLLGAAPETVATLRKGDFHATAVAGSAPVGETREHLEDWARQLLRSEKDRLEHAYAVDDMVQRLVPLAHQVSADPEPQVLTLARIQHLESHIRARVPEGGHVLELLEALHPTPAVCGFPRDRALAVLCREEPFERGWYAGPVGWFDVEGNGVFVPALRSAVTRSGSWRLFAGAGIVSGSLAELEWKETGIKFEPVLRALAASGAA
jgi:menaquinone-specific isochorismate synthase